MKTRYTLAGVILSLFLSLPAQSADGIYLSVEGGASGVADWEHTRTKWTYCGPLTTDAVATFDNGWAAFGAIGYALGQWRVEAEGGYRHNALSSYTKEGWKGTTSPDGELSTATVMVNLIYDVPLFDRISLSVGLGGGGDYARLKVAMPSAPVDEEDWHFAYQGLAGVNYALTEMTAVFLNYRFTTVRDNSYDPTSTLHLEGEDFEQHAATAGVRFSLAAPPAPIPVPPPATPQPVPMEREFMVFFGFNKWSLSPAALKTIKQAAGSVRESGSASIQVVGHTDRVGSIAYNKALSVRRAKSVQRALISEGLDKGAISVSGRGESEPMVPTADGVRESQNRRVHISF
ncbi:MAG: OmpA family protein [Alphaproteobacteria bacterium]|nr:OmpA family protein [Alphaproteobacteria bacterium]